MSRRNRERRLRNRRMQDSPGTSSRSEVNPVLNRPGLQLLSYDITFEPLKDTNPARLAFEEAMGQDRLSKLHQQVHDDPQLAIRELEPLLEQHPKAPILYNWLAAAYAQLDQTEKANALARKNYEQNPEYLFARLNMADIFLLEGKVEEATKVIGGKFDLKAVYPKRDIFHYSEFLAFSSIAIEILVKTGRSDSARVILSAMEKVAPDHPTTQQARLRLLSVLDRKGVRRAVKTILENFTRSSKLLDQSPDNHGQNNRCGSHAK